MKRIYTYGHSAEWRNLTIADIQANKATGTKMTQVTAANAEEAAVIAGQGVDMIITGSDWVRDVRRGAPETFLTAALFAARYITNEEILRGAIEAAVSGADSVLTPRDMDSVALIARQGIPVQGHVGMVPSMASRYGGMRMRGKTAAEAMEIYHDMRRLEEAGAWCCEVECVAEEALAEISKHTSLVTSSIGAGRAGDVIFLFFEDICGESERLPRHARAWGNGAAIKAQLAAERARAVKGFDSAVKSGVFPDAQHSVSMPPNERDRLREALDKL